LARNGMRSSNAPILHNHDFHPGFP
jgi:hypothetical protein